MTDIQQWRKMMPARARTPMLEPDEPDGGMALSPAAPLTPNRKHLRPKLSSVFTTQAAATSKADLSVFDAVADPDFPSWAAEDPLPNPDAERLMDSIMCRLMSDPYQPLEPRFNGMLLQIFEAYRNLRDGKERIEAKLDEEVDGRSADRLHMQHAERQWEEKQIEYKAEVERLELLIANHKHCLAEVTKTPRGMTPRRPKHAASYEDDSDDKEDRGTGPNRKETVLEFLERTKRFEDSAWSSQRATMRVRPLSPSITMRALSKKLLKKSSMTNVHASLPFGSPPPTLPRVSLSQVSRKQDRAAKREKDRAAKRAKERAPAAEAADNRQPSQTRTSFSNDTQSTFSSVGDLLPDEIGEGHLPATVGTGDGTQPPESSLCHRRRNFSDESVMARVRDVRREGSPRPVRSNSMQAGLGIQFPLPPTAQALRPGPTVSQRKPPPLRAKASGLFHRLRPQLNFDLGGMPLRRFSFEPGDDTIGSTAITAPLNGSETSRGHPHALRKSVSLDSLVFAAPGLQHATVLSPVAPSPTTSAPRSESKRSSKIPSPVYHSGARPRQEREDSTSSLSTVVKLMDDTWHGSESCSSSRYSATSAAAAQQRPSSSEASSEGLRLMNNGVGDNSMAATAAVTAAMAASARGGSHGGKPPFQSNHARDTKAAAMRSARNTKENAQPRAGTARPVERE